MMLCENANIIGTRMKPRTSDVVDQMGARTGEPVERLGGMVDRVEAPEERHRMEGPMNEVLGEVGDQNGQEELHAATAAARLLPARLEMPSKLVSCVAGSRIRNDVIWMGRCVDRKYMTSSSHSLRNTLCFG